MASGKTPLAITLPIYMKFLTILLLCTVVLGSLSAQKKFAEGYYVTESNDTVRGFIQFKNAYDKNFSFRSQAKGTTQVLSPDGIKRFGITGDRTFERVSYATTKGAPETKIFANVLIDGEINLLAYQRIFLMGSSEKKYYGLVRQKSSDDALAMKNYQANTGVLNILLQDCPAVKEAAQKTGISEDDLVKVVRSYNECKNAPFTDLRPKKGKSLRQFGFFAGTSFTSLSFRKPDAFVYSSYLYNTNFETSVAPTFGLMALFSGKKPSPVLALQTELVYSSASFYGTFFYTGNLGAGNVVTQESVTDLKYSRISLSGGIRITARSNKLHPYFSAGAAAQAFLSIESNVYQTTQINESVEEEEFELATSNTSFAAWAAAGIKWNLRGKKAIFIDVNYEVSNIADTGICSALAPRIGLLF